MTSKMTSELANRIIDEALDEANKVAEEFLKEAPPIDNCDCGFAWVIISPARGKVVSELKRRNIGGTDNYYGGYKISNPGKARTQWVVPEYEGAKAFARVLKEYGIDCFAQTVLD